MRILWDIRQTQLLFQALFPIDKPYNSDNMNLIFLVNPD